MRFEHPLAYVLGLEGIALLRAFGGEYDRGFVEARLEEVRRLLDEPALQRGVAVDDVDPVSGYRQWSATYDEPGNAAFAIEEPLVREMLDIVPVGDALDVACGTGRHTRELLGRGHRVVGVDRSPDMLDRARRRAPGAEFRVGDLERLPAQDRSFDLVVCTLALTHRPSVDRALAEFARVLRPGGHLVVSDIHHEMVLRGSVPPVEIEGRPGRLPAHRHLLSDYLRPALELGLRLRRCEEPRMAVPVPDDATADPGPWRAWPWSLALLAPDAARAAGADVPALVIWHFQRPHGLNRNSTRTGGSTYER